MDIAGCRGGAAHADPGDPRPLHPAIPSAGPGLIEARSKPDQLAGDADGDRVACGDGGGGGLAGRVAVMGVWDDDAIAALRRLNDDGEVYCEAHRVASRRVAA